MDNTIKTHKEKQINNYISSINLKEIDINRIKNDIKNLIEEEPAIKLNYVSENKLNEDGSKSEEKIEKIESITIIYTVDNDSNIPTPTSQTYIIN